jgi:hypothetical protein
MPATRRFRHPYCAQKRTRENGFRTEPTKPTFPLNMFIIRHIYYFYYLIFMNPCIVDDSVEIPTRFSFVIEFIIPKFIEG